MFLGMITTVPMFPLFPSLPNSISTAITMSKTQYVNIIATYTCLTCRVIDRSGDKYDLYIVTRVVCGVNLKLQHLHARKIKYQKEKRQAVEPD